MKITRKAIAQVSEAVLGLGARKATKYLSPKLVVKAARTFKKTSGDLQTTIVLTVGRPNYEERQFIKVACQAGESFPIKKVQLKWYKKK